MAPSRRPGAHALKHPPHLGRELLRLEDGLARGKRVELVVLLLGGFMGVPQKDVPGQGDRRLRTAGPVAHLPGQLPAARDRPVLRLCPRVEDQQPSVQVALHACQADFVSPVGCATVGGGGWARDVPPRLLREGGRWGERRHGPISCATRVCTSRGARERWLHTLPPKQAQVLLWKAPGAWVKGPHLSRRRLHIRAVCCVGRPGDGRWSGAALVCGPKGPRGEVRP
eukprot:scaffold2475_cov115-Isochrysis_galbana.AAC.5